MTARPAFHGARRRMELHRLPGDPGANLQPGGTRADRLRLTLEACDRVCLHHSFSPDDNRGRRWVLTIDGWVDRTLTTREAEQLAEGLASRPVALVAVRELIAQVNA